MTVSSPSVLSSLTREAGRQSDYYHQRRDGDLTEFWAQLESLAFNARHQRASIHMEIREIDRSPIPIKGGE